MKLENKYLVDTYDKYFSLLNKRKKYLFYNAGANGKFFKTKIKTINGKNITEGEVILDDSCLSHNFSIPPDFDFAIGGLDYSVLKNSSYNGNLYVIGYDNVKKWKVKEKINLDSSLDGFITAEKCGKVIGNFDCMTSLLKKDNEYYLYTRANIKNGVRHLQYFKSNDFKNWKAMGKIDIDIEMQEKDNYYSTYFFKHPLKNLYIGMLPYVDKETRYSCIRVVTSEDCNKWQIIKDIFNDKLCFFTRRRGPNLPKNLKPYYFPVFGYWMNEGKFNFMIHENYLGLDKSNPTTVNHYSVSFGELNEMLGL